MALHRHLLLSTTTTFFIIISIVSFVACDERTMQQEDLPIGNIYHVDDGSWTLKGLFKKFSIFGGTSQSLVHLNVNDYVAAADDKGCHDDTEAFEKAWEKACSSSGNVVLVVPKGNYLLRPIKFSGPCKSHIEIQIHGTIDASDDPSDYSKDGRHWLVFHGVKELTVSGGGIINGNGDIWWANSCKRDKKQPCKDSPTALTFLNCQYLTVKDLNIANAQQIHVSFQDSSEVKVNGLRVTAPGDSPNTDGIHVTNTQNIQISNSIIGTGDDCISIVSGSKNVRATNITCGPGHGISIGSLGAGKSEASVSEVIVKGAKFSGTTNGVRIKTWQGGSGYARDIQFMHIKMNNVTNPIIIDQNYCDKAKEGSCKKQKSAVQISNVLYQDISGSSASDVAVKFDCSDSFPCKDITMEDIDLHKMNGGGDSGGEEAEASCNNVQVSYFGNVSPSCCSL